MNSDTMDCQEKCLMALCAFLNNELWFREDIFNISLRTCSANDVKAVSLCAETSVATVL